MPKASCVGHAEPLDPFHLIQIKFDQRCGVCGTWLWVGRSKAWWRPGEKRVYCRRCIEVRLTDEGTAEAVIKKLLAK